jgi:MarR family transcriptional regulator, transcriptional regulator for hemolysin
MGSFSDVDHPAIADEALQQVDALRSCLWPARYPQIDSHIGEHGRLLESSLALLCERRLNHGGRRREPLVLKTKLKRVSPRSESADDVAFVLDDFFPHIINRITSRIRTDFEAKAKRFGIVIERWRVMVCLYTRGPQPITTLAELTSIELPTMSYLLQRMARDKFITREAADGDGRITLINLTKHGRAMTARFLPKVQRYEEIAFQGLRPSEVRTLKDQLKAVLRTFDELHHSHRQPVKRAPRAAANRRK